MLPCPDYEGFDGLHGRSGPRRRRRRAAAAFSVFACAVRAAFSKGFKAAL